MSGNFPNRMKDMNVPFQEAQQTLSSINSKENQAAEP